MNCVKTQSGGQRRGVALVVDDSGGRLLRCSVEPAVPNIAGSTWEFGRSNAVCFWMAVKCILNDECLFAVDESSQ